MELIDKEKAIEAIRAIKEVMLTNAEVIKMIDMQDVIKIDEGYIEELERKVNESRPKGKWRTSRVHGGIVKCDFCGFQWGSNEGRKFNFCPNCGADMRGEENG